MLTAVMMVILMKANIHYSMMTDTPNMTNEKQMHPSEEPEMPDERKAKMHPCQDSGGLM